MTPAQRCESIQPYLNDNHYGWKIVCNNKGGFVLKWFKRKWDAEHFMNWVRTEYGQKIYDEKKNDEKQNDEKQNDDEKNAKYKVIIPSNILQEQFAKKCMDCVGAGSFSLEQYKPLLNGNNWHKVNKLAHIKSTHNTVQTHIVLSIFIIYF